MSAARLHDDVAVQNLAERARPVHVGACRRQTDRQLHTAGGFAPVDGHSGAVRPAIAEFLQHSRQHRTEFRFERFILQEKADDAAHGFVQVVWFDCLLDY